MRSPFSETFPGGDAPWLASRVFPPSFEDQIAFIRSRGGYTLASPSVDRVAERLTGAAEVTALGQFAWTSGAWGGTQPLRTRRGLPTLNWLVVSGSVLGAVTLSFTGRIIDETFTVQGSRAIVLPRDLTYPVLADRRYHEVEVECWSSDGTRYSGVSGWNFSSAQQAGSGGAYSGSFFSADDGAWAIRIGAAVDGDTPGGTLSSGTESFGIINYDASEPVTGVWWNGTLHTGGWVIVYS